MLLIHKNLKKIKQFDKITEFRLLNSFLSAILMSILGPIIIILQGSMMLSWVISLFSTIGVVAIKMNSYMCDTFSLSTIFKMLIILDVLLVVFGIIYFISPYVATWFLMFFGILEVVVYSTYTIMLNNYITENFPESMNNFQIIKNSIWADGALLGGTLISFATFFGGISVGVVIFTIIAFFTSSWLVYNWNFYMEIENGK